MHVPGSERPRRRSRSGRKRGAEDVSLTLLPTVAAVLSAVLSDDARLPCVLFDLGQPGPFSSRSEDGFVDHGVGDLDKAGDVRPDDVVAWLAVALGGLPRVSVDIGHDGAKAFVHLLARPLQVQAVL